MRGMTRQAALIAFSAAASISLLIGGARGTAAQKAGPTVVVVDGSAPAHPFPHFWERMFGSGRAILSLRESYLRDLRQVKQVTGFEYVRFHAILDDEVGVYGEDAQGRPVYNFSYVDQIYDGLLANGVRPFVELSFMPKSLASREVYQAFWYHPIVAPPKDYAKWDAMISALANHLVARYGIDEVSKWYFEVWNEPNLDFWAGEPRQSSYWELYDHTARALKSVSPRLRVGGPASAQAAWVDAFIKHCHDNGVPADFVSTHIYGNDRAEDVFGTQERIPRNQMVCRAVEKVHEQIKASSMPEVPLLISEFNASYKNESEVTDSAFMGPWMADTIRQCDGLTQMMSYWTFSDVFEEQGVVKTPFYGGFGLIAAAGIPKPSFNAFKLLHELGDRRIESTSDSVLVTRAKDGALDLALWNYAPPDESGVARTFTLRFRHWSAKQASISLVDTDHGNAQAAFRHMGSPANPTRAQILLLRAASILPPPRIEAISGNQLTLSIPAHGLAVVKVN
jgi:xylan 1,4-beta-xylosidase